MSNGLKPTTHRLDLLSRYGVDTRHHLRVRDAAAELPNIARNPGCCVCAPRVLFFVKEQARPKKESSRFMIGPKKTI